MRSIKSCTKNQRKVLLKNFFKWYDFDLTTLLKYYKIKFVFKHSWRNWQTRKTKDLVVHPMQVQLLSSAPSQYDPNQILVTGDWFGFTFIFEHCLLLAFALFLWYI